MTTNADMHLEEDIKTNNNELVLISSVQKQRYNYDRVKYFYHVQNKQVANIPEQMRLAAFFYSRLDQSEWSNIRSDLTLGSF